MNFRVADKTSSSDFTSRINAQNNRLNILQEQISTGKRINRSSDDPVGAEMVLNLRTSQTEIKQFQRNAQAANQKLSAADDTLNNYENILEHVRTLVAQGLSDTTTQPARNNLATEIESLRGRILNVANSKNGDDYLFGGTRQNAPPFDSTTATPANTPTTAQFIQIEPGSNAIAVGVTAETVFSDSNSTVFTDLTNAIYALRGTGNSTADRTTLENTMSRLDIYKNQVNSAHAQIGANMNETEAVTENLDNSFLLIDERASEIEGADFAKTAIELADVQRSIEATLQVAAKGRRSLFDYL
ncbi:MAG TPA: flagellar hook-associated protein FlgL [Pyrinomonadaceae bacterium]|nr:flagellar hook-associated protein FlgL [Pyrinomonadaceae bacterium]